MSDHPGAAPAARRSKHPSIRAYRGEWYGENPRLARRWRSPVRRYRLQGIASPSAHARGFGFNVWTEHQLENAL